MKRNILILGLALSLLCISSIDAQIVKSAHLSEDGIYSIQEYRNFPIKTATTRVPYNQLDNFPFGALAHPTFKNTRNVSQADINDDDISEIIFCANETLYALDGNGNIVWTFEMEGTSNYPPAIKDINKDEDVDIACQTYGIQPNVGNVYLLDKSGNLFPNFPFNSDNHFFLNGVTMTTRYESPFLIASERVSSTEGRIHLITADGESLNENFPVTIDGTPAITPTIASDADIYPYLVLCSTTEMYISNLEGQFINGSPFTTEGAKFSYQSPLVAKILHADRYIIGAMHGDNPNNYMIEDNGDAYGAWPFPDDQWTYATPSFYINNNISDSRSEIFFNRPYVNENEEGAILLGYDSDGNILPNFPIMGNAGSEGLVTIGDIDGDGDQELISPSKIMVDGKGMINAYHIESGTLVDGFPLFVEGFTFLNGAYLGDVNGDGQLDLTALSYQLKFDGASPDSCFINVFDMEVPYIPFNIKFNGYKGSTSHEGYFTHPFSSTSELRTFPLSIAPNPSTTNITIEAEEDISKLPYNILNIQGQIVQEGMVNNGILDITNLLSGKYQLNIKSVNKMYTNSFVKIE